MAGFRVLPIAPALAEQVRSTLKSPQYGRPAHVELASGYGPCRACLKQFRVGEEDRILFTYNPSSAHQNCLIPPKEFLSMKHSLFALLVLALISVGCTSTNKAATPDTTAQPNSGAAASSPSTSADQDFVTKAAQGNSAEVALGKIVAAKSKNPSVKQFAQMMVKDHTAALNELQELAQTKNLNFNDDLPDDAKGLQTKLSSDTGKQLDKDYMDNMVEDHQKDVQDFTTQSQNAKDPDVKQWAGKTLPTLQKHLEKAQQIDAQLNKGKAGGSAPSGDSQ